MSDKVNKKSVVIIGAGPAGLSCAYKLLEESTEFEVNIIEESSFVGGISRTEVHNGNRMDMGGHRFFTKDKSVEEFWNKILPPQGKPAFDDLILNRTPLLCTDGPDPEIEDRVMLHRKRISRIYYGNHFFDYPLSLKISTIFNLGIITTIKVGFSYLYSCIFKRGETNLENFYINRFGKKLYQMFFEDYTQKLWGIHPSSISSDWGAQRVKGLSIRKILTSMLFGWIKNHNTKNQETSLIENFSYPKYGPGQLWSEVLSHVQKKGATIKFNCQVRGVVVKNSKVESVICKNDRGEEIKIPTDILISSMPLSTLALSIQNEVPNDRVIQVAKGLKFRSFITVGLLLSKLKLKNNSQIKTISDIPPDCWIYIQDRRVKMGRIQIFNNWSCYLVKDVKNTVWLGLEYFCNEGDEFWNKTDIELKNIALSELKLMDIIDEDSLILDYCCSRVAKAYPAYFGTYKDIDVIINYINSINNIYCVGRNGQHRYNNMDHSVLTAFRCVDHILNRDVTRDDIWKVNTEKVYHEST